MKKWIIRGVIVVVLGGVGFFVVTTLIGASKMM